MKRVIKLGLGGVETELSDEIVLSAIDEVMASVLSGVKRTVQNYLHSGAIDRESFDSAVPLAKVLIKAALENESAAFVIPDQYKRMVRNLRHF